MSPIAPTSENPSSAVVASLAFVLVLVVLLLRVMPLIPSAADSAPRTRLWAFVHDRRVGALTVAFVAAFLFFSIAGLGALLAVLVDTLATKTWMRVAVIVVDQVVGPSRTFDLEVTPDSALRAFVGSTERQLADGCGVVQLPPKGFPETGDIGTMGDYDEGLPNVYSDGSIRWSYGAVRGTYD
ncbi:hypothetical protein [Subtercola sp. YIM 133946]|uniref:hypothetical protein n=1 Tax=Subtercola sp. YIM 133946 TaxID=3118909 RepID=UPI002F92171A